MTTSIKRTAGKGAILIVLGLAAFAAGALVVNAATSMQTSAKKKKKRGKAVPAFLIQAKAREQLSPGRTVPVEISLANQLPKKQWITKLNLALAVDALHMAAGCSVTRDYRVTQIPKKVFPYKMRATRYKRAKKRGKSKPVYRPMASKHMAGQPTISMVALHHTNQDACKGATLTINFISKATTKKPGSKKRKAKR